MWEKRLKLPIRQRGANWPERSSMLDRAFVTDEASFARELERRLPPRCHLHTPSTVAEKQPVMSEE